jgi:hypothetical protein
MFKLIAAHKIHTLYAHEGWCNKPFAKLVTLYRNQTHIIWKSNVLEVMPRH